MRLPPSYLIEATLIAQIAKLPARRLQVSDAYRTIAEELKVSDQAQREFYPSGGSRWHIAIRSAGDRLKRSGRLRRRPLSGIGWYELTEDFGRAGGLLDELDDL